MTTSIILTIVAGIAALLFVLLPAQPEDRSRIRELARMVFFAAVLALLLHISK